MNDFGAPAVLVVGGTSGIGLATVLKLAAAGRPAIAAARDETKLAAVAEIARDKDLPVSCHHVDASSAESVDALFRDLADVPILGCVNTAGRNLSRRLIAPPSAPKGDWREHTEREWQDVIGLCLTGTFLVGRAAARTWAGQGRGGVLVTIASSTWQGSWGQSAYAAAKAGVVSLTRSWALELADFGIRVVCVAPGVVDGRALRDKAAARPAHADYMERLRQGIPLRRFASEDEVVASVLHALDNEYLTGTVLEVHGGGFPNRIV
ncbi:SDR family NAD(P)-dependent oxidoreductase [Saccharomonospora sp. NPDC006951]